MGKNRVKEYATKSARRKDARLACVARLGGRCQSPDCAWVNADGSKGCTDTRCLQIDHKDGGGAAHSRKRAGDKYVDMQNDPEFLQKYQLLCANCNWIKRVVNGETQPPNKETRFVENVGWQIKIGELWVPYQHNREALSAGQVLAAAVSQK